MKKTNHTDRQYGDQLLVNLSKDLTGALGRGFSKSNLFNMRFPIFQTLSGKCRMYPVRGKPPYSIRAESPASNSGQCPIRTNVTMERAKAIDFSGISRPERATLNSVGRSPTNRSTTINLSPERA